MIQSRSTSLRQDVVDLFEHNFAFHNDIKPVRGVARAKEGISGLLMRCPHTWPQRLNRDVAAPAISIGLSRRIAEDHPPGMQIEFLAVDRQVTGGGQDAQAHVADRSVIVLTRRLHGRLGTSDEIRKPVRIALIHH